MPLYIVCFKTELLDFDVLEMIGSLPAEYKRNFMRVMDEFASLSTAEANRVAPEKRSGDFVKVLHGAQRDWQQRAERIGDYFGLNHTALTVSA